MAQKPPKLTTPEQKDYCRMIRKVLREMTLQQLRVYHLDPTLFPISSECPMVLQENPQLSLPVHTRAIMMEWAFRQRTAQRVAALNGR